MSKFKILSIKGGGVRGIIPARILQEIETISGKPIFEMFDMIVGTSTGALIALALACPKFVSVGSMARFSAEDVVKLYKEKSAEIFDASWAHKIKTGNGLWGPKYCSENLKTLLHDLFDSVYLGDLTTNVVIPTYSLNLMNSRVHNSVDAKTSYALNYELKDIAYASMAAPTYFTPGNLRGKYKTVPSDEVEVDGGIWANNPEIVGVYQALKNRPDLKKEDMHILSLGTGKSVLKREYANFMDAGIFGWFDSGLIDMMIDADSEWCNMDILSTYPNLVSIDVEMNRSLPLLDDCNDSTINSMLQDAEGFIASNQEKLAWITNEKLF